MRSDEISMDMSDRRFADLTSEIGAFLNGSGDGLLNVFVPHATASLVIMEFGSGSEQDLEDALDRLLPRDDRYVHSHGSVGHGADHVHPAFLGSSLTLPVVSGIPALGTWQSVLLVDMNRDNPRRKVRLSLIEG